MVLLMQAFQALTGYMGIDLGCGEITMTQQHLHHSQICAMIQQVSSKGMPQGVRRKMLVYPGSGRMLLNPIPEGLPRHR